MFELGINFEFLGVDFWVRIRVCVRKNTKSKPETRFWGGFNASV